MILTEERTQVKSTLAGESQQFRIATNAKAFRILVDGIYSDRIGSIARELMSNAYDAHIRRGVLDIPFEVRLPNALNPNFSVRDFGCSMEHDFVMQNYSTLFESSKSASNNEVGAFGLGAKVFLAYTDSCTLRCWLHGETRTYSISLNETGVPTVTLAHRGPSKEHQGVEVTFAVRQGDFQAFQTAVNRAALGFDLLPKVQGGSVTIPEPMHQGKSWRLYKDNQLLTNAVMVRQGCAVYPTTLSHGLPYGYKIIVDRPIGTVTVTASRESLALTGTELHHLRTALEMSVQEFNKQIQAEYHALTTPIAKAKFAYLNRDLLGRGDWPMHVKLPFSLNLVHTVNGSSGIHHNPYDVFQAQHLPKITVVYDDGTKMPRMVKRIKAYTRHHSMYLATDLTQAKLVQRLLDLEDRQVCALASIPDVAITPRSTGTGAPKKIITSTRVWALSKHGTANAGPFQWNRYKDVILGNYGSTVTRQDLVKEALGGQDLLFVTERELEIGLKKGTINENNRLDLVISRVLNTKKHLEAAKLLTQVTAFSSVPHYSRQSMLKRAGIVNMDQVMDQSVYVLFMKLHRQTADMFEASAEAQRQTMANKYPLLFGYDTSAIEKYIKMCDSV